MFLPFYHLLVGFCLPSFISSFNARSGWMASRRSSVKVSTAFEKETGIPKIEPFLVRPEVYEVTEKALARSRNDSSTPDESYTISIDRLIRIAEDAAHELSTTLDPSNDPDLRDLAMEVSTLRKDVTKKQTDLEIKAIDISLDRKKGEFIVSRLHEENELMGAAVKALIRKVLEMTGRRRKRGDCEKGKTASDTNGDDENPDDVYMIIIVPLEPTAEKPPTLESAQRRLRFCSFDTVRNFLGKPLSDGINRMRLGDARAFTTDAEVPGLPLKLEGFFVALSAKEED